MTSVHAKSYLISLPYGRRNGERLLVKNILSNFPVAALTAFVNNNPYQLEFLLSVVFEKGDNQFETWLNKTYRSIQYKSLFNYTQDDIVHSLTRNNRYSAYAFSTYEQALTILTDEPNHLFLHPSEKIYEQQWPKTERIFKYKIFLSYSSNYKEIVENIFYILLKEEIKIWFDKTDTNSKLSVLEEINEGASNSDLSIICVYKNLLKTDRLKVELDYFFNRGKFVGKKNIIVLNIDLEPSDFPNLF